MKLPSFFIRSVSGSGTGPLDYESRCPVPDTEPHLQGMARGPVVTFQQCPSFFLFGVCLSVPIIIAVCNCL